MANFTQLDEDLRVHGKFSSGSLAAPNWIVNRRSIDPATVISATKRIHRHEVSFRAGTIADCVAVVHHCRAAGRLIAFEAMVAGSPTGDKAVTINLLKATVANDFVSVLASPILLDADHRDCEVCRTAVQDNVLAAGDVIAIQLMLSGASGTAPTDLVATLTWEESP